MSQPNIKKQVDSLNEVSDELRTSNRHLSIKVAKEAIRLGTPSYPEGLVHAYLNLGMNFTSLNEYDSAFHYLRLCHNKFDPKSVDEGNLLYYLGVNYSNLRDFKRASTLFEEARSIFEKNNKYENLANVENSIGIIHVHLDNYNEALGFLLKAYQIKLEHGFPYDMELVNISIVYRLAGQYDAALKYVHQSLALCQDLNDSLCLAQTYISLGNTHSKAEDYDSAIYYYDLTYNISMRHDFFNEAATVLINKTDILIKLGRSEECIPLLKEAISIADEKDQIIEFAHNELGKIYLKNRQYHEAIQFVKRSLEKSIKYSNLSLTIENTELLSQIYQTIGESDSAIAYMKLNVAYSDSLNQKSNNSALSDLRVRIETLEKENEINTLQQIQELDRLKRQRLIGLMLVIILGATILVILLVFRHRIKIKKAEIEKIKLKDDIDKAQGNLSRQTLHMIHLNNCMTDIEGQVLQSIKSKEPKEPELKRILTTIRLNKSLDKDWENFNNYFGSVHADFYQRLTKRCQQLSNHDQRVCALVKLNLSNHEIGTILNIESRSVVMLKYRIKKKLELSKEQELDDFLKRF